MSNFFGGWSKKLTAFLITVGVIILNKKFELGLVESDVYAMTGAAGAYTLGQGLTDWGKGKALVENGKAPPATP